VKLYATVTSERASKGQGGNEYLIIDLTVGNAAREQIGQVELIYNDDRKHGVALDEWVLQYRAGDSEADNEWAIIAHGNVARGNKQ
jgi:hypothetical protein